MVIYDSAKKTKVPFVPIRENEASIYVCGPTVYDDAHLGHARSALSFDLLVRTLKVLDYKVKLVKNFTDVDDKIINKMNETGQSLADITNHFIERYLYEMDCLGVLRGDIEPKATENIQQMSNMIQNLIDKESAYLTPSGDVYFDTSKDSHYGSISHKVTEDEENQSRINHNSEKQNPKDFAMWKACSKDDSVCFDSPFSRGRPGWHIECSAMIDRYFDGDENYHIDIHAGGVDLLFPHHENEAAQSRCATGKEIAKYWMHNGFVQIAGDKMSKSLGNSFFLKDALKIYDAEVLRFYLISIHYRNDFNFVEEDLLSAKKRLDKLYRLKKRVALGKASIPNKDFKQSLLDAMSDDLNISVALSVIDEMIASTNEELDKNPKNKVLKKETIANIELIGQLLGVGGKEPYSYFQIGIDDEVKSKIEALLSKRDKAKKSKDFETSDSIRDELNAMDIAIMDTADGTIWEKI
ncbi:MAG: cysteine--tRNA ligase [Sulfurovum sp.]|nr:cysteine--tRNA ligase [Sulfurovum sp.]